MNRRNFLKNSAFGLTGAALLPQLDSFAPEPRHIGVQLWSVREPLFKDPKSVLTQLSKQGYREVELFGFNAKDNQYYGMSPQELKSFLNGLGIKVPSSHNMLISKTSSPSDLGDDFKKSVEASKILGQKYVICPYMADEDRTEGKKMADIYNAAGEYCKKMGLQFGYHNHDFELKTKMADGRTLYETLLSETDPKLCIFEMDLYWVVKGGYNPLDWFRLHPGRFQLCHVKDMAKTTDKETVEVGEGSINFQEIFNARKQAGLQYYIVELENYKRTPVEGVGVALNNLKKLKF